mmetsp:Transcript_18960/g.73051  ORF Transcript_18960/g.73051 Transcript_18960/m.73051 type:complete len:374 (-) Transcript_18960:71-1192(-)|eukprot:CAMPEP_0114614898 /NCGR_PEP_ID=MMETSP0168-20121206/5889_1 /TAXON_ID=95228 ORGANISM="Vannella sp., Strain DIVA3 517/6/12" /NCGR_SAMPLE_ID=MMETSP0168 /ASSEMBLY_ACC=CAM_ASM_000044 /LENGTH=373 /DNA_ID=CAMNT_0001825957 /DNA_START=21 /DNA_END=1142 /DNA_ORIENTATION=-
METADVFSYLEGTDLSLDSLLLGQADSLMYSWASTDSPQAALHSTVMDTAMLAQEVLALDTQPQAQPQSQPSVTAEAPTQSKGRSGKGARPQLSVTVPRDKLVNMSRAEFDQHVKDVTGGRKLLQEEVLEVRRQRKLIKNRLSASVCRKRKRQYVTQLEGQIKELEEKVSSTSGLEQKARALEERNRQLEERLAEMQAQTGIAVSGGAVARKEKGEAQQLDMTLMRKIVESSPSLSQMYRQLQFYQKQLSCSSADMKQAAVLLSYTMAELNLLVAANLNNAQLQPPAYCQPPSASAASPPVTSSLRQSIAAPALPPTPSEPLEAMDTSGGSPLLDQRGAEMLATFLVQQSAAAAAAVASVSGVEPPACPATGV